MYVRSMFWPKLSSKHGENKPKYTEIIFLICDQFYVSNFYTGFPHLHCLCTFVFYYRLLDIVEMQFQSNMTIHHTTLRLLIKCFNHFMFMVTFL